VVPAGYLLVVDRRFAPLALVAIGMMFARPFAGAHTWPHTVCCRLFPDCTDPGVGAYR